MKTFQIISVILAVLMPVSVIYSQDKIHKRNNEIIDCKVKEIGIDVIKYTLSEYPEDVMFNIDKEQVAKVVFSNGKEITFEKEMLDPANYTDNKKNAIKMDFLSPLTGNTTFVYERSTKPGRSFEATLGIIGLGKDVKDSDPIGIFTSFGMKFIKSPDFYLRGMRYAHILKGSYVKPELILGYYSETDYYYDYNSYGGEEKVDKDVLNGALFLNIGKQWVFDNVFLVDFNFGVGYGFESSEFNDEYQYSFMKTPESPFSFKAGLKVGFLF